MGLLGSASVSAAAVGTHVVCWVVSSLAGGFLGLLDVVRGSLFPLILD